MDTAYLSEIISVSVLNDRIKALLEDEISFVRVEGEVSNLRRPSSGHLYFTLKDARSQIRAVIFRSPWGGKKNGPAEFALEEGMHIVCIARVTVYHPRGEYQLIIETVEPKGLGALQKAFEQLKIRLAAEGLFDESRKRAIPFLPTRIGVITSPSGAVIRDILTVTLRRFPSVDILIAPVRVQGIEAAAEIVSAMDIMQEIEDVDVIIVARGGGSLEDLAPFNDERVARAIATSRIPVISAVGHETDFTIADFTADLRAATPSAAAEVVVPRRDELLASLKKLHLRMAQAMNRLIIQRQTSVRELRQRLKDPKKRLSDALLALDDYTERINRAVNRHRETKRRDLAGISLRLGNSNPAPTIKANRLALMKYEKELNTLWGNIFALKKNRAAAAAALLESLNPEAILKRGYSITRRLPDMGIIRRLSDTDVGKEIEITIAEGKLGAKVTRL